MFPLSVYLSVCFFAVVCLSAPKIRYNGFCDIDPVSPSCAGSDLCWLRQIGRQTLAIQGHCGGWTWCDELLQPPSWASDSLEQPPHSQQGIGRRYFVFCLALPSRLILLRLVLVLYCVAFGRMHYTLCCAPPTLLQLFLVSVPLSVPTKDTRHSSFF